MRHPVERIVRLRRLKMQTDWQAKTIWPNGLYVQIDCNSGRERTVRHAACNCGEQVLIEYSSRYCDRADGKRVFYPESADNVCVFRCRGCHECVHLSVPGAEYGPQPNT